MNKLINKIKKSINLKFCLWIAGSLVINVILGIVLFFTFKNINFVNVKHVDYDKDRYDTEEQVLNFINDLYLQDNIEEYIKDKITKFDGNAYICDTNGDIKYANEKDGYAKISKIDLDLFKAKIKDSKNEEFNIMYPINISNSNYYFINIKNLKGISTYTFEISYVIAIFIPLCVFIALIYIGIRRKVKYIEYISSSINEIAKGDLNYDLLQNGDDELALVAKNINIMEKSLLDIIKRERESEKNQYELITNISHDLKTPLTIILGYMDILRKKVYKDEEEKDKYTEVVYEKAELLQKMILDLFELVKLGNKEITLNKSNVNITKLLGQALMEYEPVAEEKSISIQYIQKETILVDVDLEKILRVFNNLLSNAVKYSNNNDKITVEIHNDEAGALIKFSNPCKNIKEKDLDNIFNRFYRGDKARNSEIEGSGLGLSIVKKIIELHNSNIWAELNHNEISFIIRLRG